MRLRPWGLLAAALAACSDSSAAPGGGDATTLDGIDSSAFARVADLAPLATRAELSAYATAGDLVGFATTAQLAGHATLADLADYATKAQLSGYATAADLADYATNAQLSAYATRTQLDVAVAACVATTDPRLADARAPLSGSADYVQNGTSAQAASFRITGSGHVGALAVAGDAQLAGNLAVGGTIAGRVATAGAAPVACDAGNVGYVYFDTAQRTFRGCDGDAWVCLGGAACTPARSCKDLLQTGASVGSGLYTLQGAYAYRAYCDMVSNGGGWTLVVSSAWSSTFMNGTSSRWSAEDGTDSPPNALDVDHKAVAFDQVGGWSEVRVTTSTGTRTFEYRFPAQAAPLRSVYASGRTLVGSAVLQPGTSQYAGPLCTYPVLNGTWATTDGAMTLRLGVPERGAGTTDAGFPCGPSDGGAGTSRSGSAAPYWPGQEGLGFVVGGRSGFATCDGTTRTFCAAGETPRVHVWIR